MNILLAEDDSVSAALLRRSLEKLGHHVTAQANGAEAWPLVQSGGFQVVISDWMMPKMDGLELCRQIRSHPSGAGVYFILLTSKNSAEDRLAALEAGADDFLVKPLDAPDLMARLDVARRILSMQQEINSSSTELQKIHSERDQQKRLLGDILVTQGVITQAQLQEVLASQAVASHGPGRQRLGALLVAKGWASEEQVTRARCIQMDVPYADVTNESPDAFLVALVPHAKAVRYQLMPLSIAEDTNHGMGRLRVAMADPWDIEAIDWVQRETRRRVEPMLASEGALMAAIERVHREQNAHEAALNDALADDGLDGGFPEDGAEMDAGELMRQSDQAPVIRFVNTLFADAVRRRASDIHLEPRRYDLEVSYRIDGQLQTMRTVPRQFLAATTSRIKIMAEMDISERRLPLDGRISLRLDGKNIVLRVSTLPTQYGERIVMRVLDRSTAGFSLDNLGFSAGNQSLFEKFIHRPHGIILVTGPTGSGKTTTLYAALNALKQAGVASGRGRTNIITCEDPIEYELDGIAQSNVNEKAGLTFARQLRAILRQDPDVVLVGEIRDAETAEIAFRAALTGHLVLSTLHCNEAAGAASRLLDMGVPPFLIASTLVGVVSQRLVRKLCPLCRREVLPDADTLTQFRQMGIEPPESARLYEAVGCLQCDNVGSKGRIAVHEVMTSSNAIQRMILKQADTYTLREAALEAGMVPMIIDGLEKAGQGLAPVADVLHKIGHFADA